MQRPQSLILIGASRLGKTVWARSLGPHIYFQTMFNMDDFSTEASYGVFDDMKEFDKSFLKPFFGAQERFVISDKYKKKRTITWGNPCIYLQNKFPDFGEDKLWWEANCQIVFLTNKLY